MQTAKHTPGPWITFHKGAWGHVIQTYAPDLKPQSRDIGTVFTAGDGRTKEQCKADARLVAAAPDLLNALSVLADAADVHGIPCDAARAAIAKATGEQA